MKYLIGVLFSGLIIFVSCEKTDFQNELVGEWNIIGSGGGIAGQGDNYDFNTLVLDRKGKYQFIRSYIVRSALSDTVIERGSYKISKNETDFLEGYYEFQIELQYESRIDNGALHLSNGDLIIQMISQDSLCLGEPYADGCGWCFIRRD